MLLLLLPLPIEAAEQRWPALTQAVQNFGHPLLFAWLAHLVFVALRQRMPPPSITPYVLVLAGAVVFGAATELAQTFTARTVSMDDLVNDTLGAGFALLVHACSGQQRDAWRRHFFAAAAALTAIALIAPLALVSAAYVERALRAPVLWEDGSILSGRFSYWQTGWYTGLVINEPTPDWTAWHVLEVDLENTDVTPLPVVVRVDDRRRGHWFRDRYNGRFVIEPGARDTLRIPLDEIRHAPEGRTMEMDGIRGVAVFTITRGATRDFKVHGIRLAL